MPAHDFLREWRTVEWGGRRFRVGKPTVGTVLLVLGLFPSELLLLQGSREKLTRELALNAFLSDVARGRTGRILATCVESDAGDVSELVRESQALGRVLIGALLSLCDAERILDSLGLDEAAAASEAAAATDGAASQDGEDRTVQAIGLIAQAWKLSPVDVTGWPYEAYLTAFEELAMFLPGYGKQPKDASAEDIERSGGAYENTWAGVH